jgi:ankyrin repeat protein
MNESKDRNHVTAADVLSRYNEETLPDFLEPLTDVNQIGGCDNRPIHLASYRGILEDVIALVEGGADVNVVGDMGYTPLHEAAQRGHFEVVKFLLEHGACSDVENEFGYTALDVASWEGHTGITALLASKDNMDV